MLNRGYSYTTIIGSKHHGQTLLSHLASHYPHSTPQAWQQNLNNGEVILNGVIATGSESLTSGQTLVWNRQPWIEPDAPQHFEVLLDDPNLLAVNKPSGLPTLPGGGFLENTLLRLVQRQFPHANPVHRLGRATSGIVLFAKTPHMASNLEAIWNTDKVQKIYLALAQNIARTTLRNPHTHRPRTAPAPRFRVGCEVRRKTGQVVGKGVARNSNTKANAGATTFKVSLHSGRPHQIRIHLASIGHPLVGDPLYGVTGQPLEDLPGLPGDGGYFLPGGDIGSLAVHGTVNDLAVCGATPLALSASFILEEGYSIDELRRVVASMSQAADAIPVPIATGDTKVVDRGKGDGVYVCTSAVGRVHPKAQISPRRAQPGDVVLLSGDIAAHGIAVLSARENLGLEGVIISDTACILDLVWPLFEKFEADVHVLRDPTRGGVAAVLNEIALAAQVSIEINEAAVPVSEPVLGACELLGLDPLYVANEGKCIAIVAASVADSVLEHWRSNVLGKKATRLGIVRESHPGLVTMRSRIGATRVVDLLSGEQLPRIC